ncbi:MAG: hypothetical protein IKA58_05725 [Clostridia bacterium]|nr:hypothetical protein [Clostridia bacterium]
MEQIITIIILAILVETIIEYFKKGIPAFKNSDGAILIASAFLGILLCFTVGADVLAQFGLAERLPYVGTVLTGIVVGGGSNMVFDFVKRIRGAKEELKVLSIPEDNTTIADHEEQGVG